MEHSELPWSGIDEPSLKVFLGTLCDRMELDHATYVNLDALADTVRGATTYPHAWEEHYLAHNLHMKDPVVLHGSRSIRPLDWDRLRRDDNFDAIFFPARDFGIPERGLTVPIRGPYGDLGLFSVASSCNDHDWGLLKTQIMGDLLQSAVHVHDAVQRSGTLVRALHHPVLSPRELEVLQWIAMGKGQSDIGDILSISQRTVEVHLRSARTKLGALSTAQAVGRGIALRLIEPA